jgi:pectate lyase
MYKQYIVITHDVQYGIWRYSGQRIIGRRSAMNDKTMKQAAFFLFFSASMAAAQTTRPALAFLGAEGFGSHAAGGRGGQTVHVTNLNDDGPGSLRQAVSQEHRTIVFDVSGHIPLKSPLHVLSNITIDGSTAPSPGIGTVGAEISLASSHDLIFRYIRFRQGLAAGEDKKSAVNLTNGHDIIFDHVSVEWGRWDTMDLNTSTNLTIQYCIVGEGVDPQRFGCLCQCDGVTFSHNLFINNQSRNPKAKGKIQYINNVVYNWGVVGLVGGHSAADHVLDVIGNYFIAGPSSSAHCLGEFTATDHVYSSGNRVAEKKDGSLDGRPVVPRDFGAGADAPTLMPSLTVPDAPAVTIDSADAAYEKVLGEAGDSPHRDAVDQRLINEVKSLGRLGKVIHDPAEVGGLKGSPPASKAGGI